MGVHDVAEYVKYHQAKLREQHAQPNPVPVPAPAPSSAPKPRGRVNEVRSGSEFKKYLEDNPDKLIVVDFFATWCGPCKIIAPVLAKLSNDEQYLSKTLFLKVDVDNVPDVAQEYSIRAMPTLKFIKGGDEVAEVVGANLNAITQALSANV